MVIILGKGGVEVPVSQNNVIHQYMKEIPMDKKKEHKGKRTTWRSALRTKKERSGRQIVVVP